ncbi:hypothetical protein PIB30_069182 [Stylosanthes scabra]|uniref:Transposase-associated domain-containing protein n=1 Tax=Stylosanthes scabra TaxID=79078 RepID=A0ABU6VMK7_9FABA|nr:hypothetical protein [Stylosanthes scabra]
MGDNNRSWMYDRVYSNSGGLKPSFVTGLDTFLHTCSTSADYINLGKIRCPCAKCKCKKYKTQDEVRDDEQGGDTWDENAARYQSMVVDAFPHQHAWMDDRPLTLPLQRRWYATELGRVPSQSEVFLRTHTRKKDHGQFVDEWSEQQIEQHKAEIKRLEDERAARIAAGEPAGPPIDKDEVWDRIAAGRKRGRVYGKGKVPKRPAPRLVDPEDALTCSGPDAREHITLLNRKIQQQAEAYK